MHNPFENTDVNHIKIMQKIGRINQIKESSSEQHGTSLWNPANRQENGTLRHSRPKWFPYCRGANNVKFNNKLIQIKFASSLWIKKLQRSNTSNGPKFVSSNSRRQWSATSMGSHAKTSSSRLSTPTPSSTMGSKNWASSDSITSISPSGRQPTWAQWKAHPQTGQPQRRQPQHHQCRDSWFRVKLIFLFITFVKIIITRG